MKWDDFVKTTSKTTAETDLRENRSEILKIVSKQGYYDNYQGVRISSKGNRFKIKNAVIWNVNDENGNLIGQAAYFKTVQFIK